MVETEVERILREIRERVISQQPASQTAGTIARPANTNGGNGVTDTVASAHQQVGSVSAESLAAINSYLTTTARTWDRLPPLVSNRNGLAAKLELWLKRRLRAATRWFTWEQVNFNASVHHALSDLLPALSALESARAQEMAELRARIVEKENHRIRLDELRAELESVRNALEALRTTTDAHCYEGETAVVTLAGELRQRLDLLQAEQRVSFKQLVLETSEAAVMDDRARRKTETLFTELQRRVEQLEKGKSDGGG